MERVFATAINHRGEGIGMAYLERDDKYMLAFSKSRAGLGDALLDCMSDFEESYVEDAIDEVLELTLPNTPAEYGLITGDWAAALADSFMGLISLGYSKMLSEEEFEFKEPLYGFHQSEDNACVYFTSMCSEPKVMQLFSKQQCKMIVDEGGRLSDNPKTIRILEKQVDSISAVPEESDIPPNIIDGKLAVFIVSILLVISQANRERALGEVICTITPDECPWKENHKNN